ncbi:hypothetical protein BgiBS90_018172, partial [Biomphalaria glabrata]
MASWVSSLSVKLPISLFNVIAYHPLLRKSIIAQQSSSSLHMMGQSTIGSLQTL